MTAEYGSRVCEIGCKPESTCSGFGTSDGNMMPGQSQSRKLGVMKYVCNIKEISKPTCRKAATDRKRDESKREEKRYRKEREKVRENAQNKRKKRRREGES